MQTLDDINLRETGQLVYPKQRASTKQRFPFGDTKCDFSVSFLNFCAIKMKLLEFYVQLFFSACLIRLKLMHFFFFFLFFFFKKREREREIREGSECQGSFFQVNINKLTCKTVSGEVWIHAAGEDVYLDSVCSFSSHRLDEHHHHHHPLPQS